MFVAVKKLNAKLAQEVGLSALIFVYIFYSIVSLSPDSEPKTRLMSPVNSFWEFWGFNQNWALFSPVIRNINYHVIANITFEDDTIMSWQVPRMDRLDLLQRFRMEKFRKWGSDSLPWPDYKEYWPDFARAAGRLFYTPTNKPKQFSMFLWWSNIPDPKEQLTDRYKLPPHVLPSHLFTYFYQPRDFQ